MLSCAMPRSFCRKLLWPSWTRASWASSKEGWGYETVIKSSSKELGEALLVIVLTISHHTAKVAGLIPTTATPAGNIMSMQYLKVLWRKASTKRQCECWTFVSIWLHYRHYIFICQGLSSDCKQNGWRDAAESHPHALQMWCQHGNRIVQPGKHVDNLVVFCMFYGTFYVFDWTVYLSQMH